MLIYSALKPTTVGFSTSFLVGFHCVPKVTLRSQMDSRYFKVSNLCLGQFSFQSQRKAIPKNAQTTTELHASHMLVK